jgi:Delta7-sterol 5-desaturase
MKEVVVDIIKFFTIITIRYLIIAGAAFLIFYKLLYNRFYKAKIQSRLADKADFIREITHSMLSSLILSVMGSIVLFSPMRKYTLVYTLVYIEWDAYPQWWLPVSLLLSLILHDTYFYWMHRFLHYKKIFRLAHLVHHKSTNPSPWASNSFHFFEAVMVGGIIILLAFLLPLHPITIALFVLISFIANVYGHLGYEIMPRSFRHSFLFQIINTSVYHNLHHSKFKGNYSLYFRVWDRLLKTEHPDYVKEYDRIQQRRFGVKAKESAQARKELAA